MIFFSSKKKESEDYEKYLSWLTDKVKNDKTIYYSGRADVAKVGLIYLIELTLINIDNNKNLSFEDGFIMSIVKMYKKCQFTTFFTHAPIYFEETKDYDFIINFTKKFSNFIQRLKNENTKIMTEEKNYKISESVCEELRKEFNLEEEDDIGNYKIITYHDIEFEKRKKKHEKYCKAKAIKYTSYV